MKSRIVVAVSLFLCALQASAKTGGQNRPVGRGALRMPDSSIAPYRSSR